MFNLYLFIARSTTENVKNLPLSISRPYFFAILMSYSILTSKIYIAFNAGSE